MPELLLLRHAKSDWNTRGLADLDRPLNSRGQEAARAIGRFMATLESIDTVWASPAVRVQQTLAGIRDVTDVLPEQEVVQSIYSAESDHLIELLRQARGDRVLLVGHNPGMHDLATRLSRGRGSEARDRLLKKFPTGALAELRFEDAWAKLDDGNAKVTSFTRPRDL